MIICILWRAIDSLEWIRPKMLPKLPAVGLTNGKTIFSGWRMERQLSSRIRLLHFLPSMFMALGLFLLWIIMVATNCHLRVQRQTTRTLTEEYAWIAAAPL